MASDFDIAGLGPNTNSTYGDFQYLTCDTIRIDNVLKESVVKNTSLDCNFFYTQFVPKILLS